MYHSHMTVRPNEIVDLTGTILAGMLVEDTGRALMDSGDYYGRAWQRNQGAVAEAGVTPLEFFMAQPEAWVTDWSGVTLSIFHFLRDRVQFDPKADHAFRLWLYTDSSDRWDDGRLYSNSPGTVERWLDRLRQKGYVARETYGGADLTYNHDNLLSQDMHWVLFHVEESSSIFDTPGYYAMINIHGGCDARGGYTDFRTFFLGDWEESMWDLLDFDSYEAEAICPSCERRFSVSHRHGDINFYDAEGNDIDELEHADDENGHGDYSAYLCPIDGERMPIAAYPPVVG